MVLIMEIKPTLSEFVWDYAKSHNYCSRIIISGKYIDKYFIGVERRDHRKPIQKQLSRKISYIFTVMKYLGICNQYSLKTVAINREKFNNSTLKDVLGYNWNSKSKN
jgi:hypothetical protein